LLCFLGLDVINRPVSRRVDWLMDVYCRQLINVTTRRTGGAEPSREETLLLAVLESARSLLVVHSTTGGRTNHLFPTYTCLSSSQLK
jgi:hypothetical protein